MPVHHLNRNSIITLVAFLILTASIISCSGGGKGIVDPALNGPVLTSQTNAVGGAKSDLWGLYDVGGNPSTGEINVTPLRTAEFQANATRFLQPPASGSNLLTIKLVPGQSDIPKGLIACDITIHHPFIGTKFWGFDVRGIVMGTPIGEVGLLNQDGYTRWWNPVEFTTVGTIFGYTEGKLAPQGPTPETTIHPYKYFANSLGAEDPMEIAPSTRGVFNPNTSGIVTRRYVMQFPMPGGVPNFHFKYAVTAGYHAPDGPAPWTVDDFPIEANQAEAYQISILDTGSNLYNEKGNAGGDLNLKITVYDWQKPYNPAGMTGELAALKIKSENLGLLDIDVLPTAMQSAGPDFNSVSYMVTLPDLSPETSGLTDLLITAESANVTTYAPDIDGVSGFDYPQDAVLSSYNKASITVSDTAPVVTEKTIHIVAPNGGEIWTVDSSENITWYTTGSITDVKIEYSTSDVSTVWNEITPSTPNDGVFEWTVPPAPTSQARVRISDVSDSMVFDLSDSYFTIAQADDFIYVDDSSTSPDQLGTKQDPFKTITGALVAAVSGKTILVDDSGSTYTESVVLAEGVTIQSQNWDISDGGTRAKIQTPNIPGACTIRGDAVNGATISGFDVRPGGSYTADFPFYIVFAYLTGCSDILITNCYFNVEEKNDSYFGVVMETCSNIEVSYCHFDQFHGPENPTEGFWEDYKCVQATNSPNLTLHNLRMNDIGTNFDTNGHNIDAVYLDHCDNATIYNNLVYNIHVNSDYNGAALVTGFSLHFCNAPVVYNNTVDLLDTVDNFFINQDFCYFYEECPNGVFYNNIASNVTDSGWAPDGSSLGRGIQSYLYDLPCDYTLTWNIDAAYFQQAFPNIGCVASDPQYIDPANSEHDIQITSEGQLGNPTFVDWDDTGTPSGDPANMDPNTRSRMGAFGGPYGGVVGITG
jgi:hypothetical protein